MSEEIPSDVRHTRPLAQRIDSSANNAIYRFSHPGVPVAETSVNISQSLITITKDRLELCLIKNKKCLNDASAWQVPAGILVSISATLASTTFKDFIFEAAVWKAIFIIALILSIVWLIKALLARRNAPSIATVIEEIRKPND